MRFMQARCAGASSEKSCHIKLRRIIKESSVWRAFNIICIIFFYCDLYTMAIDVTWRIIKKWCIWSLHVRNFLCLPVFALFLQKIRRMSRNSLNFIYIYLKLKLGTLKCICLKWVFLPQWQERSLMLTLLKSLVIPLLGYCCQLWNPWKAKDIQAIEAIQWIFTYNITEVQHLNYREILHELKLCSLHRLCECYIIIYIFRR